MAEGAGLSTGQIMRLLRRVLPVFLLLVAACAPHQDAEQARLCRMLLPALMPVQEGITLLSSEAGHANSVHITFFTGPAYQGEDEAPQQLLSCRFGGAGYAANKRQLTAVSLNGQGFGEAALHILRDIWLTTQEAIAADPGPPRDLEPLFEVSRPVAVGLQFALGALPRVGILALLALATALIYGLIGRINLAFGEFAALGGIAAALVVVSLAAIGTSSTLMVAIAALAFALALGALQGACVGRIVLAPLMVRNGQAVLLAGVGMMLAVQEGLRLAQGSGTIWVPPADSEPIFLARGEDFEVMLRPGLIGSTLAMLAVAALVLALMRRSTFGRAWRASADDPFAASLMGISPRRMLVLSSALATGLCALAGAGITLNYGGMPFSGGTMLGLTALIAAILGGVGSPSGAVLGAIVIGFAQMVWGAFFPLAHWELASFSALTLAMILRPNGLLGRERDHPER